MSRFFSSGPQQTYSRNQTGGVPRLGSDANLNAPGIDPGTLASHSEGLRRAEELGRILGLAGSAASEIGQHVAWVHRAVQGRVTNSSSAGAASRCTRFAR